MGAFYNEIDPYAAQWLRNLIEAGHIAPGVVDERSIVELDPDELRGYTQCHFFAGIGGWSYALRLAGWSDDRPVWTGSCPCQPFSAAGKQRGSEDERHLWPAFFRLIRECRPGIVVGEQVAGAAGLAWLDHVCSDLEGAGYAAAAADLPACSVGAPHRRQRLYWVAHSAEPGRSALAQRDAGADWRQAQESGRLRDAGTVADAERGTAERCRLDVAGAPRGTEGEARERQWVRPESRAGGVARGVAYADTPGQRLERRGGLLDGQRQALGHDADGCGPHGVGLADASGARLEGRERAGQRVDAQREAPERASALDAWHDLEWIECSDGKARPTQPGIQPLAHGIPNRVGRLRAYGNAIVPQVAAAFLRAAL